MLVVSGIILTCLSGLLLTGIIGTRFSWTERIGLSFPLGMTLQTVVMALLDLMHIPLTSFSVLSAGGGALPPLFFFFVPFLFYIIRRRRRGRGWGSGGGVSV